MNKTKLPITQKGIETFKVKNNTSRFNAFAGEKSKGVGGKSIFRASHLTNFLQKDVNTISKKLSPPLIKTWLNGVYNFNQSLIKNLPSADNVVYKLIKSYFFMNPLWQNLDRKKSRLLVRRFRRASLNRIELSKPEIKHTSDKVFINLYIFNKRKNTYLYKLNHIWGGLPLKTIKNRNFTQNTAFLRKTLLNPISGAMGQAKKYFSLHKNIANKFIYNSLSHEAIKSLEAGENKLSQGFTYNSLLGGQENSAISWKSQDTKGVNRDISHFPLADRENPTPPLRKGKTPYSLNLRGGGNKANINNTNIIAENAKLQSLDNLKVGSGLNHKMSGSLILLQTENYNSLHSYIIRTKKNISSTSDVKGNPLSYGLNFFQTSGTSGPLHSQKTGKSDIFNGLRYKTLPALQKLVLKVSTKPSSKTFRQHFDVFPRAFNFVKPNLTLGVPKIQDLAGLPSTRNVKALPLHAFYKGGININRFLLSEKNRNLALTITAPSGIKPISPLCIVESEKSKAQEKLNTFGASQAEKNPTVRGKTTKNLLRLTLEQDTLHINTTNPISLYENLELYNKYKYQIFKYIQPDFALKQTQEILITFNNKSNYFNLLNKYRLLQEKVEIPFLLKQKYNLLSSASNSVKKGKIFTLQTESLKKLNSRTSSFELQDIAGASPGFAFKQLYILKNKAYTNTEKIDTFSALKLKSLSIAFKKLSMIAQPSAYVCNPDSKYLTGSGAEFSGQGKLVSPKTLLISNKSSNVRGNWPSKAIAHKLLNKSYHSKLNFIKSIITGYSVITNRSNYISKNQEKNLNVITGVNVRNTEDQVFSRTMTPKALNYLKGKNYLVLPKGTKNRNKLNMEPSAYLKARSIFVKNLISKAPRHSVETSQGKSAFLLTQRLSGVTSPLLMREGVRSLPQAYTSVNNVEKTVNILAPLYGTNNKVNNFESSPFKKLKPSKLEGSNLELSKNYESTNKVDGKAYINQEGLASKFYTTNISNNQAKAQKSNHKTDKLSNSFLPKAHKSDRVQNKFSFTLGDSRLSRGIGISAAGAINEYTYMSNAFNKLDKFFDKYVAGRKNNLLGSIANTSPETLEKINLLPYTATHQGVCMNDAIQEHAFKTLSTLTYKKKIINQIANLETSYIHYLTLAEFNNSLFKNWFINPLCNIISMIYNKKVIFNIVSLKAMYFNSDILSNLISLRLNNHKKNRYNKVFKKVLRAVALAKVNEHSYNSQSEIYKSLNKHYQRYNDLNHIIGLIPNNNIKATFKSMLEVKGGEGIEFTGFSASSTYGLASLPSTAAYSKLLNASNDVKANPLNAKNNRGTVLKRLNTSLINTINFIKHKSVFGIRLEASGRLTKRSTASRKIFKFRYLGNLRLNDTINRKVRGVMVKDKMTNNLQFSKISSKTRNGAFGIKGWINQA